MFQIVSQLAFMVALGFLFGCATTDEKDNVEPPKAFATVEGDWVFSHAGPATVGTDGGPDVASVAQTQMQGTKLRISADGTTSMIGPGNTSSFKLKPIEETNLYTRFSAQGAKAGEAFTYDKQSKLLSFLMNVKINELKGKMPLYFARPSSS